MESRSNSSGAKRGPTDRRFLGDAGVAIVTPRISRPARGLSERGQCCGLHADRVHHPNVRLATGPARILLGA